MTPEDKIYFSPFLKLLPIVVLGVVVSDYFACEFSLLFCLLCFVSAVCAVFIKRFSSLYLYLCVFLFSFTIHSYKTKIPTTDNVLWSVIIEKPIGFGDEWTRYSAYLSHYKSDEHWHETKGKVMLIAQNSLDLKTGEQVSIKSKISDNIYKYYSVQGYLGNMFLTQENIVARSVSTALPLRVRFAQIQQKALAKLNLLELSPTNKQVASTMILGYKPELQREVKQQYSWAGSSHLLAVSGLHIGILFVLINFVLSPLKTLPLGHRVINILTIIFIWLYAFLTGLSPSALRSAFMFSALQVALFSSLRAQSLNTLFSVAMIMILLDTNTLFDLSFQLSFTAVFFIVTCYNTVYSAVRVRNRWLNYLLQMFCISFVASVGVMPLSSYIFGVIPLWGVLLSPLLVFLAGVVLWLGILWILLPLYSVTTSFQWALDSVLTLQNNIVLFVSNLKVSHIVYFMPKWLMILLYVFATALALGFWLKNKPQKNLINEL